MPPQAQNTALYETLECSKDSTPEQIKRSYRQLALRYHPDKNQNDPSATDRFKQIQHAYEILSDPNKRAAYDQFGENGVAALDNQFASPFVNAVGGAGMILAVVVLAVVLFLSLLLTVAGIAARLDSANDWTWTHSLFGLWFLDFFVGIIALLHIIAVFTSLKEGKYIGALAMLATFLITSLFLVWTVLVAQNLDSPTTSRKWSWVAANAPIMGSLGIIAVVGFIIIGFSTKPEAEGFQLNCAQSAVLVVSRILSFAAPVIQIALISLKADALTGTNFDAVSWYVVLLPAFLFTLVRGISSCGNSFVMAWRKIEPWGEIFRKELSGWFFGHLLYLVGVGLIAQKLADPDGTTRSWGTTLVPWFIFTGGGTLLLCCMMCQFAFLTAVLAGQEQEQQQQGEDGNHEPVPPPPRASNSNNNNANNDQQQNQTRLSGVDSFTSREAQDRHNEDANSDTPIVVGYGAASN